MDFVIVANAWAAAQNNPTSKHQIALELVSQGHRVLWVEGAGMRRPNLGSGADRGRIVRKLRAASKGAVPVPGRDLWVLSPLLLPLPSLAWAHGFNGALFRCAVRRWSGKLSFQNPVLINYVPVLAGVMKGWGKQAGPRASGALSVYHCVDRWDRFEMYDTQLMKEMDAACHHHADLVIASSGGLEAHCRQLHDAVHRVDHGVNYEHFSQAPHGEQRPGDLPSGTVIGFIGLLSEWVDQDLLLAVANACPQASVVLIGTADVSIEGLAEVANIHILGPRPFEVLPSYVRNFDVGLIPFIVNELTRAVNPIKLREMLAAGCPVVSTALPEVARYEREGGGITIADGPHAFVDGVRRQLEQPVSREERQALSVSMQGETWQAKCREILDLITAAAGTGVNR